MGYVQIYTGDGKGKTTCAMGLALRALGNNFNVHIIQFMKPEPSGEIKALKTFSQGIVIENFGCKDFLLPDRSNDTLHKDEAEKALKRSIELIKNPEINMLILDEAITAAYMKLIDEEDLVSCINKRLKSIELILTGRGASENLKSAADLVTEMNMVKHYYTEGVSARKGIEY
jgi:cob(I)alamin adenosyltransferase